MTALGIGTLGATLVLCLWFALYGIAFALLVLIAVEVWIGADMQPVEVEDE